MKRTKHATAPDEQIDLLISRGMAVPDREGALHFARHIGERVLREYLPLQDSAGGCFHPDAEFNRAVDLFVFDRKLRLVVMDAAGRVEISVRAQMEALGELPEADPQDKTTWMSMGKLSRRYQNIPFALRQQIAGGYGMDAKTLVPFLHHLTGVRNACAHHERIWNHRFPVWPVLPAKKPALKPFFNTAAEGKIYNTLVILAHLTDIISPQRDWARQLLRLLDEHGEVSLAAMGFPNDWREMKFWAR